MRTSCTIVAVALIWCLALPSRGDRVSAWGDPIFWQQLPTFFSVAGPGSSSPALQDLQIAKTLVCYRMTLFLTTAGDVFWMGSMYDTPSGDLAPPRFVIAEPTQVSFGTTTINDIACTSLWNPAFFALSVDGRVFSWGFEFRGLLGRGAAYSSADDYALFLTPSPMVLPAGAVPIKVAPSALTTNILLADGTALAYGVCRQWCQLSTETSSSYGISYRIIGDYIVDVSTHTDLSQAWNNANNHTIVCTASGTVYTFGYASQGLMIYPTTTYNTVTPYAVPLPAGAYCKKVYAAFLSSLVLLHDGRVITAGNQYSGFPGMFVSFSLAFDQLIFPDPNFLVQDLFLMAREEGSGGVIAVGAYNGKRLNYVWGGSSASEAWLATSFVLTATRGTTLDKYMSQNRLAYPTFCHGVGVIGMCTTSEGGVWGWGDYITLLSAGVPPIAYTLPELAPNTVSQYSSVPSAIIPDSNLASIFHSKEFFATFLTTGKLEIWQPSQASQLGSSSGTFYAPDVFSNATIVEIAESSGATYALLQNGTVGLPGLCGGEWYDCSFHPVSNFSAVFARSIKATNGIQGGVMALINNYDLIWILQEPWPGAINNSIRSDADTFYFLNSSAIFPPSVLPSLRIVKIWGEYQSYFILDETGNIWAIGDNSNGQLCFNVSGVTGFQQTATLLDLSGVIGKGQLVDIITSPQGAVIVTSNGLFACGSEPHLNEPTSYPAPFAIPLSLGSSVTIVTASVSAGNALVFTSDDHFWALGMPFPSNSWTQIDTLPDSSLNGQTPRFMRALPYSGGFVVSAQMAVAEDLNRRLIPSTVLSVYGVSFGTDSDSLIRNSSVTLTQEGNIVPCTILMRSARTISCAPTSRLIYNDTDAQRNVLSATVQIGNMSSSAVIGKVSSPPSLTIDTSQWIASNADEVTLRGTDFSLDIIVKVTYGNCTKKSVTATEIVCALGIPGGTLPGSFLQASVQTPEEDSHLVALQIVATIVPPPAITSSSVQIAPGTTELTISGSGFNPNNPSQTNTIWIQVDQGPFSECAVLDSNSTEAQLICRLNSTSVLGASSGTVYAIVRSYNGKSAERAIAVLGNTQQNQNLINQGLSNGAIGGIIAGVLGFFLILAILVFVLVRRRMRLNIIKGQATVDVPAEMASMFNIKSNDLEIVRKLGEGSFGAVFLCKWKGRLVALKKLTGSMMSSHINDFFREAALMTGIPPHKNVVRIYGMCQEMNNFSLVMEYLQKGSLDSYVLKDLMLPDGNVRWDPILLYRVVLGTARGMAHLAGQGIVHRDLAARNILLSSACEPKVSDFGMSRVVGADQNVGQTASTVGPIRWMPPESLANRLYSEKSDVWSYGVLLYEIALGREPFENEDMLQIAVDVRDSGRNVLTHASEQDVAKIPSYIVSLMQTCFRVDPNERPSFEAIIDWLGKCAPPGYTEAPSEDAGPAAEERDDEHLRTRAKSKRKGSKTSSASAELSPSNAVEMHPTMYTSMPSN